MGDLLGSRDSIQKELTERLTPVISGTLAGAIRGPTAQLVAGPESGGIFQRQMPGGGSTIDMKDIITIFGGDLSASDAQSILSNVNTYESELLRRAREAQQSGNPQTKAAGDRIWNRLFGATGETSNRLGRWFRDRFTPNGVVARPTPEGAKYFIQDALDQATMSGVFSEEVGGAVSGAFAAYFDAANNPDQRKQAEARLAAVIRKAGVTDQVSVLLQTLRNTAKAELVGLVKALRSGVIDGRLLGKEAGTTSKLSQEERVIVGAWRDVLALVDQTAVQLRKDHPSLIAFDADVVAQVRADLQALRMVATPEDWQPAAMKVARHLGPEAAQLLLGSEDLVKQAFADIDPRAQIDQAEVANKLREFTGGAPTGIDTAQLETDMASLLESVR
ncbi:MAG: M14 family metallopeptidase [Planctomycetota bacterium]|jgi:hypothetical protein